MTMPSKTFLYIWLAAVFLSLSILAAVNYSVDPFLYFSEGQGKRTVWGFDREHKAWQAKHREPDILLLGNSRNFYGFDISKYATGSIYNYSVPGAELSYLDRQLQSQLYFHKPKELILAIDSTCSKEVDESKTELLATNDWQKVTTYFERISYLLSLRTFERSYNSLSAPLFYDEYGKATFVLSDDESNRNLLARVENREFKTFGKKLKVLNRTTFCSSKILERLLSRAYKSGIPTTIIINPMHVRYMSLSYFQAPQTSNYMTMRYDLVRVNEELANKFSVAPFEIYDFRRVNSYTTEKFKFEQNIEPDYWYESSHYREILGDRMIEWMRASRNERDLSFGIQLTSDNVDSVAKSEIEKLMKWNAENHFVNIH